MIIGLSGYAKSGKDEVAKIILRQHREWEVRKFSGKLKEVATVLTGIPSGMFESQEFKSMELPGWDMTVREFLQRVGTEGIRNGVHPDAWVNALFADYYKHDYWIITDCRFPNEAQAIKDRGGKVVRIVRPGVSAINAHSSETALDDWDFDYVIHNDGTLEDLMTKALEIL